MAAVTIVVGMKLIGSIMISAIIVIPAVASMRLFKNFKIVVLSSGIISVVSFIFGFLFSSTFVITKGSSVIMLPVGATIVCFNVLALLVAYLIGAVKNGKNKAKFKFGDNI
jgi:zinc transport system permease protein